MVFEKDLGTSLLVFGTVLVMLYIATERAGWLLIGGALLVVGFFLAYQMFGHVRVRVNTWLDPLGDYQNTGYQISQSLFGLATAVSPVPDWAAAARRRCRSRRPTSSSPRSVRNWA